MRPRGFEKPLYVLPFDHRGSFETGMFGWKGALTPEQTAQINVAKQVIYDGFKTAVAAGAQGESRHPGGRAVRCRHTSRRGCARLCDGVPPRRRADRRSSTEYGEGLGPIHRGFHHNLLPRCWCATTRTAKDSACPTVMLSDAGVSFANSLYKPLN